MKGTQTLKSRLSLQGRLYFPIVQAVVTLSILLSVGTLSGMNGLSFLVSAQTTRAGLERAIKAAAWTIALLFFLYLPVQASLTGTDRGTGGSTGASTVTVTPGSNYTANSYGVLALAFDNAGSNGSAVIAPSSATDSIGNVWTLRLDVLFDNGAASAGMEVAFYTATISSFPTSASLTITWTAGSPVARYALHEVTSTLGGVLFMATAGGTGATSATPSVTTSSITSGDMVVGVVGLEGTDTFAGDADSTNGSWSAHQHSSTGSGTSAVSITSQRKVVTGTATQTYNVTNTSGDTMLGWLSVTETGVGMGKRVIRM